MITISPIFFAHHRRSDGTYPAKMRVTFRRRSRWLPTTINARADQLTRSLKPKDPTLIRQLDELRSRMYGAVADLGPFALEAMDVDGVVKYIKAKLAAPSFRLDFIAFGREVAAGKHPSTGVCYVSALNSFARWLGRDSIDVNEITVALLRDYAEGCGLRNPGPYLGYMGHIYKLARQRYNDEDSGALLIPRDPFSHVDVDQPFPVGARALDHDTMQRIISAPADDPEREALDLFVLSFALMGANMADLLEAKPPKDGIWEYERMKTRSRRQDRAAMRVKVPSEVAPILKRLAARKGGRWWLKVGGSRLGTVTFRTNRALHRWAKREGVESFTFYSARKTFATEARRAGAEKATIDECLAHVGDYRLADIYIERQWGPIWATQRKVLKRFKWGR